MRHVGLLALASLIVTACTELDDPELDDLLAHQQALEAGDLAETPTVTLGAMPAITNDATPTMSFTGSSDAVLFWCRFRGRSWERCTTTRSHTPVEPLVEGEHVFWVYASDASGRTGPVVGHELVVDVTAPVVVMAPSPTGTSALRPTMYFTVTGGAVTRWCRFDGSQWAHCTGTSSHRPSQPLSDGWHKFEVFAADSAGNRSPWASQWVRVLAPVPTVVIHEGPTSIVYTPTTTFAWTSSVPGTATYCRAYRRGYPGGTWLRCESGVAWRVSFPQPPALVADWTFEVAVRDVDGALITGRRDYQTGWR